MIQPIAAQLRLTVQALLLGGLLGLLYRLGGRAIFGHGAAWQRKRIPLTAGMLLRRLAVDLGFGVLCLIAVLLFALIPCEGALRLYHLISMGCGAALVRKRYRRRT